MEIKQKYRFIVAFISLLCLLSLIQETYGKYVSNASANTNISMARWSILLNNQDITNNSNFSNVIVPVFPASEHIAANIIAPLSEGYFDIVINATSVDVSFTETIALSYGTNNTVSDLVIVGYSLNNGSVVYFNQNQNVITRDVLLSEVIRTYTYRVYVKWNDGQDENMNNAADTQAAKSGIASIKIDVNFVQKPN